MRNNTNQSKNQKGAPKNSQGTSKNRLLMIVLIVVLSVGIGTTGYYLNSIDYFGNKAPIEEALPPPIEEEEPPAPQAPEPEPEPTYDTILPKYEETYNKNNDLVGWISVPETKIDYPVMQSTDNDYYLHRDFNKKYLFDGIPFMDFRNISQPDLHDNTLIYGHNMGNKNNMFTELMRYTNIDFYKKAPVINFDTIYRESEWKVIAVAEANTERQYGEVFEYYNYVVAKDQERLDWYLNEIYSRSYYHTDVDVALGDKLLTLQTCTNDKYDTKLIVVARRVRPGESPEVDVTKAVLNPNRVLPR